MSRVRQENWMDHEKMALAECLARCATLAETVAATGRTDSQIKERLHNNKQRLPANWKQDRRGFAFENVAARGSDRSVRLSEINQGRDNPRLALRKFSWESEA